jgi:hypothetical protein
LYLEIGMLKSRNHRELAGKRKLEFDFFPHTRKIFSHDLYWKTRQHAELGSVLRTFEEHTGLSLHDIEGAFREGDWKNSSGNYSYGGPKWASIAQVTISLLAAITEHDTAEIKQFLEEVGRLEHNNGQIVDKFRQWGG